MDQRSKPSNGTGRSAGRAPPHLITCHPKFSGANFPFCAAPEPSECLFAVQFGLLWYCTHPHPDRISSKTG